jgi:hypothetical protein
VAGESEAETGEEAQAETETVLVQCSSSDTLRVKGIG